MNAVKNPTLATWATVVGLALTVYPLAVVAHEVGGHAWAAAALGGQVTEVGSFYVDWLPGSLGPEARRFVALAGALVNLVWGLASWGVLGILGRRFPGHLRFGLWLLGTVNLLMAAGYPFFSAITGLGDFGPEGALAGLEPAWLWRLVAGVGGAGLYAATVTISLRLFDRSQGRPAVPRAAAAFLLAYVAGGLSSVGVGLLNPRGWEIVLVSAAASSLGGTSALAWMATLLGRTPVRNDGWTLGGWAFWLPLGLGIVLTDALVLGPTLKLSP